MKPTLCEKCVLQAVCTKSCNEHNFERITLLYQLHELRRYLFSQSGIPRKHIKMQQLKHYRSLTKRWSKNIGQSLNIQDRRFIKEGKIRLYDSFKGVMCDV